MIQFALLLFPVQRHYLHMVTFSQQLQNSYMVTKS